MADLCIHDWQWRILSRCAKEPRTISSLFKEFQNEPPQINYRKLETYIRMLATLNWLLPVNEDGSPAFERKKLPKGRIGTFPYDPKEYPHRTTRTGIVYLDLLDLLFKIETAQITVSKAVAKLPSIDLRRSKFHRKQRKDNTSP